VKNENKNRFFQEDAEYYLAMSYLNKESNKAMPIFEKIYADGENPTTVMRPVLQNVKTPVAQK
jgi:hypothetical protein